MESECADHCRVYALSDTDQDLMKSCRHDHSMSCASCEGLRNVIAEIEAALFSADIILRYVRLFEIRKFICNQRVLHLKPSELVKKRHFY